MAKVMQHVTMMTLLSIMNHYCHMSADMSEHKQGHGKYSARANEGARQGVIRRAYPPDRELMDANKLSTFACFPDDAQELLGRGTARVGGSDGA